jgi:hypothetical protein
MWFVGALGICAALVMAVAISRGTKTTSKRITPATPTAYSARSSSRLDADGWQTVQQVLRLRTMALAARRTSMYRSYAAYMGLQGLMGLRPVRRGRCAVAVLYLYNNLLDLFHAYPGEDWQPLRLLIPKQPSLRACAPNVAARTVYVS